MNNWFDISRVRLQKKYSVRASAGFDCKLDLVLENAQNYKKRIDKDQGKRGKLWNLRMWI